MDLHAPTFANPTPICDADGTAFTVEIEDGVLWLYKRSEYQPLRIMTIPLDVAGEVIAAMQDAVTEHADNSARHHVEGLTATVVAGSVNLLTVMQERGR